ncbi:MAG: UDP-N-acetylmuramate dehydrogenase [Treponema sp.]|nr:UDP-N-acetylmuramate dehydrogenase [Treponema sp.]
MNDYQQVIALIKNYDAFKGQISFDEPMSQKTTFKVGGTADLFIKPLNYYSFQIVLNVMLATNTRFFILGGGSNIVFPDGAFHGVVISTQDFNELDYFPVEDCPEDFGTITLEKDEVLVTCFSGTPMATLVNFCTKNCISGLEQFAGLPGSVGGALFMNARCFDKSISDVLFSSSYMDYSGQKVTLEKALFNEADWDYKKSPYQSGKKFITTATFKLKQQTEAEKPVIEAECKKYINERVSKGHFKFPSAGSVFKNNHDFGKPSGKIIDECGLKGYSIGGAQVAPFHGNFIINNNHATAKDIKDLVEYIKKFIYEKTRFLLETEIIFVDNQPIE